MDEELTNHPSELRTESTFVDGRAVTSEADIMPSQVKVEAVDAPSNDTAVKDDLDIIDSVFGGLSIEEMRHAITEPGLPDVVSGPLTLSRYFGGRREPSPRINPCLMVRGNSLFVYGGVVEVGDVEVALDDCWALDLNKRDRWRQLLPGTMHSMVWQGEDDATEGTGECLDLRNYLEV